MCIRDRVFTDEVTDRILIGSLEKNLSRSVYRLANDVSASGLMAALVCSKFANDKYVGPQAEELKRTLAAYATGATPVSRLEHSP